MKEAIGRRVFMRVGIEDVELSMREFSGTVGIQQMLKKGVV